MDAAISEPTDLACCLYHMCLHGHEYSGYEDYPVFDHIQDVMFRLHGTQRNQVIHISVHAHNQPSLCLSLYIFINLYLYR